MQSYTIKISDAIKQYDVYVSSAIKNNSDFLSFHMFCAMMHFKFIK